MMGPVVLHLPPHPFTVGIDEVGLGPWAGPVMAGAVVIHPEALSLIGHLPLRDSKKLSALQREKVYEAMMGLHDPSKGLDLAVGSASVHEIDTLGLRPATYLAMHRALEGLTLSPTHAVIDGTHGPKLGYPTTCVVRGDATLLPIAAAAIIAKVTRDRYMKDLDALFPLYHWKKNAGYGTAEHQAALHSHGITPHHRASFKPIARLLMSA